MLAGCGVEKADVSANALSSFGFEQKDMAPRL
jgi:hypothetical protein